MALGPDDPTPKLGSRLPVPRLLEGRETAPGNRGRLLPLERRETPVAEYFGDGPARRGTGGGSGRRLSCSGDASGAAHQAEDHPWLSDADEDEDGFTDTAIPFPTKAASLKPRGSVTQDMIDQWGTQEVVLRHTLRISREAREAARLALDKARESARQSEANAIGIAETKLAVQELQTETSGGFAGIRSDISALRKNMPDAQKEEKRSTWKRELTLEVAKLLGIIITAVAGYQIARAHTEKPAPVTPTISLPSAHR